MKCSQALKTHLGAYLESLEFFLDSGVSVILRTLKRLGLLLERLEASSALTLALPHTCAQLSHFV